MSKQVQHRRGTTTQHATFTGAVGEVTVDTSRDCVVVHDGSTIGGFPHTIGVTVNSISALRAVPVTTNYNVSVTGYYTVGDAGGGYFYGVTGGSYTDNGGTIITNNGGTDSSAWLRVIQNTVDPRWFGATADGVTDAKTYIIKACDTGKIVDGGGLTYAISGTMRPITAFAGLQNIKLTQTAPTTADCRTLFITDFSNFFIRNVTINRGGSAGYTVGTINDYAGLWATSCTDFIFENVLVTNGGRGNGYSIQTCSRFEFIRVGCTEHYWQEVNPAVPVITDDIIQAIWTNSCSEFSMHYCYTNNVTSGRAGDPTYNVAVLQVYRYTRWPFSGNNNFAVNNCISNNIDQCFDVTGSVGNNRYTFTGCLALNGGTNGFKVANCNASIVYTGCIAYRVGARGFVVGGKSGSASDPDPRDTQFVNCMAIDTGSNGIWAGPIAFAVEQNTASALWPAAVTFVDCKVIDRQVTPTTSKGFYNDVAPITYPATNYDKPFSIYCVNCVVSVPGLSSGEYFDGIHHQTGVYIGLVASIDSVSNTTWTTLNFDAADLYDPAGLHNPSSANSTIFIKQSGLYAISVQTAFAANAVGSRAVRVPITGSGGPVNYNSITIANSGAGQKTFISGTFYRWVNSGEAISLQAWQDSGGALNIDRGDSVISIAKMQ